MRKVILALSIVLVLVIAVPSFAYTVSGTWTFDAKISEQTVVINGISYDVKADETGTVVINTTSSDGAEYFNNHVGTVNRTVSKKLSTVTSWDVAEYKSGPTTYQDEPVKYISGNTFSLNDSATMFGAPVKISYSVTQTAENTIEGKVYYIISGDQTVAGTVLATRPAAEVDDGTSSGMCNVFGLTGLLLFAGIPLIIRRKRN
jgi:Synergist-CTERM protein sorting domain-containing protein